MRSDHVRAGIPVLAEADRDRDPRAGAAGVVPRRPPRAGRPAAADGRRSTPRSRSRPTSSCRSPSPAGITVTGTLDGTPVDDAADRLRRRVHAGRRHHAHARRGCGDPGGRRRPQHRRRVDRVPAAASAVHIRCTRCCRSSSRPSWAPWACRTCWCASTPTPTGGRRGAPRWPSSRCCRCSTCSRRCWGCSRGCTCPQLLITGTADAAVLLLPQRGDRRAWPGNCWPRWSPPAPSPRSWRPRRVCWSASPARWPPTCCGDGSATSGWRPWSAALVPIPLALAASSLELSRNVGLVFAVAASTLCPLLVLGIWWRGLTAAGAVCGWWSAVSLSGAAATLAVAGGLDDTLLGGWPAVARRLSGGGQRAAGVRDHDRGQPAHRAAVPARRRADLRPHARARTPGHGRRARSPATDPRAVRRARLDRSPHASPASTASTVRHIAGYVT